MAEKWFPYKTEGRTTTVDISLLYNSPIIRKNFLEVRELYLKNWENENYVTSSRDNYNFKINDSWYFYASFAPKTYYAGETTSFDVRPDGQYTTPAIDKPIVTIDCGEIPGWFAFSNKRDGFGVKLYYWYVEPTMQNVRVIKNNVYEDIEIALDGNTGNKSVYYLNGSWSPHFSGKDKLIVPRGTISANTQLEVRACNKEDWDTIVDNYGYPSQKFTITGLVAIKSQLYNLTYNNTSIQNSTLLTWVCQNQEYLKIEILQSNVIIYSKEEYTSRNNFTIPVGIISTPIQTEIKVYVKQSQNTQVSDANTLNISFTINKPNITNLSQIGEYWEKQIEINFRSENQTGYEYELYQSNNQIGSGTGALDKRFFIAEDRFTQKENCTVRVRVCNAYAGITEWSNWQEISLRLQDIQPTLSNLALSGSNIDLKLVFSWGATDQQKSEVEIKKDDAVIKNYNGTTTNLVEIPPGTLTVGLYKFRVRVAYKDRWTAWQEITVTLVETLASIGVLEPDGIIVPKDDNIRIWWISTNQSKWELTIDSAIKYAGTTTKEIILPPGKLTTDLHTIELKVYYVTPSGITKDPVIKKAEFIAQGPPPRPTLISSNIFTSSRPNFIWDTQDQQGYILDVLDNKQNIVYSTDWQNGLVTDHKVLEYLANGTYTVRIKVMNQYSLESDYGTQQITINAAEPTTITLNAIALESSIMLSWDNPNNKFTKFYILRNGIVIARSVHAKYIDHTAWGECTYIVRGITDKDVYKDSNRAYAECNIRHGIMATLDKLEDNIEVGLSRDEFNFNGVIGLEATVIELSGRELPVMIFGEHRKGEYSINFVREDMFRFIDMCKRRRTFLYRDNRQKLYLTINSPSYKIDHFGLEYNIQATEVDYKEGIEYD